VVVVDRRCRELRGLARKLVGYCGVMRPGRIVSDSHWINLRRELAYSANVAPLAPYGEGRLVRRLNRLFLGVTPERPPRMGAEEELAQGLVRRRVAKRPSDNAAGRSPALVSSMLAPIALTKSLHMPRAWRTL